MNQPGLLRTAAIALALLLTAAAAPGGTAHDDYAAASQDLPAWAEPGAFRFIRVDGGPIETMKAERTHWGKNFSAEDKDVLTHIYDRDFDRMLDRLVEARFNWIWVTWSNGWSLQTEAPNRTALAEAIAKCHDRGIKVTAYLSASNAFWKDMAKHEPESLSWLKLQALGVVPVYYLGLTDQGLFVNWERRLMDARDPRWRAYLVHKAELAVVAGADAILYDNIIGDTRALRRLIGETQAMAAAKAAELGRDKALVYANIHLDPYRFAMNDSCDVIWEEAGKDTPGLRDGRPMVDNIRKIKFLAGEKQPWQPLKFENDVYRCGPREKCIPSPAEQKLGIAEAYAFGAALSRNIEGRFLGALIRNEPEALEAWAAISAYNGFVADHPSLYQNVQTAASIALLGAADQNPMADLFLRQSVMFETKVIGHLDKGVPLENFKVLVVPFGLEDHATLVDPFDLAPVRIKPSFGPATRRALREFLEGGGQIFAPRPKSLRKALGVGPTEAIHPLSRQTLERVQRGEADDGFIAEVQAAAGGPLVAIHGADALIANVSRQQNGSAFIVHLLNYDLEAPVRDLRLTLRLGPAAAGLTRSDFIVLTPDGPAPDLEVTPGEDGTFELRLSEVVHYAVVRAGSD